MGRLAAVRCLGARPAGRQGRLIWHEDCPKRGQSDVPVMYRMYRYTPVTNGRNVVDLGTRRAWPPSRCGNADRASRKEPQWCCRAADTSDKRETFDGKEATMPKLNSSKRFMCQRLLDRVHLCGAHFRGRCAAGGAAAAADFSSNNVGWLHFNVDFSIVPGGTKSAAQRSGPSADKQPGGNPNRQAAELLCCRSHQRGLSSPGSWNE